MAMKPTFFTRFAGVFLVASGLFALAALVCFGTFGRQTPAGNALAVGGLFCLVAWVWGRSKAPRLARETLPRDGGTRGRTLLLVNALASTLLLGVVLVGVNYLAARRHFTFDLTPNRVNSLSDQTLKTLNRLPATVRFTYFYATPQADPNTGNLLAAYARASDKVRVESVNALREPARVPPSFNGAPLVVARLEKAGAKAQEIGGADEANVTSALLRILDPRARTLYFLQGHGEVAPTQLTDLQRALETQNYALKTLSLSVSNAKIPADCAALLILAPQVDLAPGEAKILSTYAANQGRLMVLLSPTAVRLARFDALLNTLGIVVGEGYVSDSAYRNPQWPVGVRGDTSRHPILRGVSADCVFPASVPLQMAPVAPNLVPLFQSSAQSQSLRAADGSQISSGPFVLAAASQRGQSRALISASANIAVGQGLALFGNKSFVLSGLNWVVGNETLVSIPAKTASQNTLQMPETSARFASLWCVAVMPLASLLLGALVWWKRR